MEYAKPSSTLWHMLSFSSPFIYQQKEPESSSLENKVRVVLDLSSSEVRFQETSVVFLLLLGYVEMWLASDWVESVLQCLL